MGNNIVENLFDTEYHVLVSKVLNTGFIKEDRTNTGTISNFGNLMKFDLSNGDFPLLTTKKMNFSIILKELLFFIKGQTNNKILKNQGVNIWNDNSTKDFLIKNTQRKESKEDDLGPIYGFQWRHYGAEYLDCDTDYSNKGIDQLNNVINEIKQNPYSRRLVVTAWNPKDIQLMALPPCHLLYQFEVSKDKEGNNQLNCMLFQRSGDLGLGIPYNIASYSLLLLMVSYLTNIKVGTFVHSIADTHIYLNHIDQLKDQIKRKSFNAPGIRINPKNKKINKIEDFDLDDFELLNYESHEFIKMKMAI